MATLSGVMAPSMALSSSVSESAAWRRSTTFLGRTRMRTWNAPQLIPCWWILPVAVIVSDHLHPPRSLFRPSFLSVFLASLLFSVRQPNASTRWRIHHNLQTAEPWRCAMTKQNEFTYKNKLLISALHLVHRCTAALRRIPSLRHLSFSFQLSYLLCNLILTNCLEHHQYVVTSNQ